MKNKWIQLFNGCLLLLLMSCHKDKDCEQATGIHGEWIWVKSVGGFGGWTQTPESDGVTKKLKIDDFQFEEYLNDSLVFKSAYDLEMRNDTVFGTNTFIQFENGGEQAILINKTQLQLFDQCADCFSHTYKRN